MKLKQVPQVHWLPLLSTSRPSCFGPSRHADGVVAQQGHQRMELVGTVVHRQEERLHAHQPHEPLREAVVADTCPSG